MSQTKAKAVSAKAAAEQKRQSKATDEQIRQRAYEIYLSRNGDGAASDEVQDWLQAERELNTRQG